MGFFDAAYRDGRPPWDIGRPQPELVRLEEASEIVGRVLDVGCGTGENAYFFAEHGHETWGVDLSPTAIGQARAKGPTRRAPVDFRIGSALELEALGERFDTITDCGLFHTFSDGERTRYVGSLRSVLRPGGRLFVLCFSDREPADWGGPRRVTEAELAESFAPGWKRRWIRAGRFATNMPGVAGHAWVGAFERAR